MLAIMLAVCVAQIIIQLHTATTVEFITLLYFTFFLLLCMWTQCVCLLD